MKLNINNEFGSLKSVAVCWGKNMPVYKEYKTDDPEFTKYHPFSWDKDLLLKQQESFFDLLEKYNVKLVFPKTEPHLIWQMYTRDTAFVIGEKLYYSTIRKLQARNGEVESLLQALNLPKEQLVPINSEIEGGDVIVSGEKQCYVGHGSRTTPKAIKQLEETSKVKVFEMGENVMHLDTRLTLLPKNIALVNESAFDFLSLEYLNKKYDTISVTDAETKRLGTNVFVIDPETVIVPAEHSRIGKEIQNKNLKVEVIDYSEPINLSGSFRCTTLPLDRE